MGILTSKLSTFVNQKSQRRGLDYFLRGAVEILVGDPSRLEATVQGTIEYDVEISLVESSLEVSCTCPYYDSELETCKHIWATFLAAEKESFLSEALAVTPLRIFEKIPGIFMDAPPTHQQKAKNSPAPTWKQQLDGLRRQLEGSRSVPAHRSPSQRELIYLIDTEDTLERGQLVVHLAQRDRRMDGSWGKLKFQRMRSADLFNLSDPADRRVLAILLGAREERGYGYSSYYNDSAPAIFALAPPLWEIVLPLMCATGRCSLRVASIRAEQREPLRWDDGEPWEFCLTVKPDESADHYTVRGILRRTETEMELEKPILLLAGGLVCYEGRLARLQDSGAFGWISFLRENRELSVPRKEADTFVAELLHLPKRPKVELPDELKFEVVSPQPKPCLRIKPGEQRTWQRPRLKGELSFDYGAEVVPNKKIGEAIYRKDQRRMILRDLESENAAEKRLRQLGFRSDYWTGKGELDILPDHLPKVVRTLTNEGWRVEADGKLYRTAGEIRMEISSAIDWFELSGSAQFDDTKVSLPQLLLALKKGEHRVKLDDGTFGVIPEEWIKKYGLLAALGNPEETHLRFARPQIGLLDALLAAEPAITADVVFQRARQELFNFTGVAPGDPPAGFAGELRDYQRDGLGWLIFLQRFGFGGCLADDMGLGKTIQVLALLESRRVERENSTAEKRSGRAHPALVVVPRSLVFHWKIEAARFAPKLRVLDHTGIGRLKPGDHFNDYDVIISTYGTLRSDALQLKDRRFDYCILDEAQAIKNAGTLSAKAVRLLRADHRLALSGTPVENHLGELWSLFEFLNPGMLGSASMFGRAGKNPDAATRGLLAHALRPFILRRTKDQVARELPPKSEQTIYCDLEGSERKRYDELLAYYRSRVLKNVERDGMARVKIQVLEALLRLRQAACHPGLIDKSKIAEPSAKVDTLLAQLDQVLDEGHKVLVFSQFTSLLAIVRSRLDKSGIPYVYLDGRTRDRQARVEQFQNDPKTKLFLISLKAGGLGLNLHAAEYVYLLDPWWNPAVETQAIDRAHRIGQTRHVFAYRLIARDTVEEKVLELQKSKRDLADAIITANNSLIRNLTRDDLELLLS